MTRTKKIAREWIEVWGRDDPATLPLADGFVHVSPFGRLEGREKYLAVVRPLAEANVAALEVEDVIAEGDRACVRFSMNTPEGRVACCDWVVVEDGRIVSVHSYYDSRNLAHFERY